MNPSGASKGLFSRLRPQVPAQTFGLAGRGTVAVGQCADLVVFDPETVAETATFDDPCVSAAAAVLALAAVALLYLDGGDHREDCGDDLSLVFI